MKRFIALILSIVFIFSAFSATAYASTDAPIRNKISFENGISVRVTEDYSEQSEQIIYVKGDKSAAIVKSNGIKLKTIAKDNSVYVYFPAFPFFYIKQEGLSILDINDILAEPDFDFGFLETYQEFKNGITYDVDVYENETGYFKIYSVNNDIKLAEIKTKEDEFYTTLSVEIVSTHVDDRVFELPFFAVDLAPFLEFIYSFFS